MLMAADILIHNADIVPVGRDQKQHIEIARDTAEKFNRIYCKEGEEVFKLPEAMIIESVETVPGIDGQKMSKSYGNHIPLFAEDDEIRKLVMSIVTDSSGGVPQNVYNIHKLFKDEESLKKLYDENEGKYKVLKEALAEDLIAFIAPLRARRAEIAKDPDHVRKLLARNGAAIRDRVAPIVAEARRKTGLVV